MEKKGALIIGVSIIMGCLFLGFLLKLPMENLSSEISSLNSEINNLTNSESESNRYQIISANDNNIILLDTKTGEYWRKFIKTGEGPTNWEKASSPDINK